MSQDLEQWVASLPSLDSNLDEAQLVANATEAHRRFTALSTDDQQRVVQMANERFNLTPEKVASFTPDEKTQNVYRTVMTREKPFESGEKAYAERYGQERAANRHGYLPPARRAQLEKIASIQAEAKRTGKSFSEIADAMQRR